MRRPLPLPAAIILGLAACSGGGGDDNAVDVAAASRDRSDVARDATSDRGTPPSIGQIAAVGAGAPGPIAASDAAVEVEAPDDVVRRYVSAIAARRYGDAWRLWDRQGAASGMTEAAFAASFGRFASYDAVVGAPFGEDAGAGQRYVTVPVTVTGTLRSGEPFRLQGPVVLHTIADGIESDDPDAHAWRIRSSELKPRSPVTGAGAAE